MKNLRLHNAVQRGFKSFKVIEDLVKNGVDINNTQFDYTPLNEAIELGDEQMVRFLLNLGADINKTDRDGFSPLQCALINEQFELVKCLIEMGALDVYKYANVNHSCKAELISNNEIQVLEEAECAYE